MAETPKYEIVPAKDDDLEALHTLGTDVNTGGLPLEDLPPSIADAMGDDENLSSGTGFSSAY
jgi:hypothetical protein